MNARRRKFAHEYVRNGFNGVQAAIAVGYTQNYGAARVTAHRLLTDVNLQKRVEDHINRSKMSADEVLETLTEVAKTETKISGSEKLKALELLGKGHKLFTDKVESTDTSERDGTESAILKTINQRSTQFQISLETSAIQLYLAGKDDLDSPLSKVENFGKYSAVIREYVSKSEIQESSVEQ